MIKRIIKEYSVITFGIVLAAVAIYFFMLPSHIVIGSGTALAMMLNTFIPLPVSSISLILNMLLLTIGFLLVGPEFGGKTVYASVLLPIILAVFEKAFPNFQSLTEDPFLDMICYILICGLGMAILFSKNASAGGLDIVAKIMSVYMNIGLGHAVSISGVVVALSSVFFYDTKTVVLSVLGTFFSGIIVERLIFGLNIKRRVCIISEHLETIVNYILGELHSGATLNEIIGAYDRKPKREVITIVDQNEYRMLMDFVKKTDPQAFITVYSVNEMRYRPK